MTHPHDRPFVRDELLDEPGIVGARWWQEGLSQADPVARRTALKAVLVTGGLLLGALALSAAAAECIASAPDWTVENRAALDMQKQFGWNFGAVTEALTFDGASTQPFDRTRLAQMPAELAPRSPKHLPYYVPTLFLSPSARPQSTPAGDSPTEAPLGDVLSPIYTAEMGLAYAAGQGLAALLAGRADVAVVVDLPGDDAVAFAAGAVPALDPIFTFDNWPHPRGVVPAHRPLAAAAYYQPLFAKRPPSSAAPPLFVLDSARLTPYSDDATQFDNRHLARLPAAAELAALGVRHVLYVSRFGSVIVELDDLNDDFVLYARAAIELRALEETSIRGVADAGAGMDANATDARVVEAGVAAPRVADAGVKAVPPPVALPLPGVPYSPAPRTTPFSTGAPVAGNRPVPAGFGTLPVVVAVGGAILGAKLSRSGSWTRASSSSGWGGG